MGGKAVVDQQFGPNGVDVNGIEPRGGVWAVGHLAEDYQHFSHVVPFGQASQPRVDKRQAASAKL